MTSPVLKKLSELAVKLDNRDVIGRFSGLRAQGSGLRAQNSRGRRPGAEDRFNLETCALNPALTQADKYNLDEDRRV